jgi:hypothetical protein
MVLNSSLGGRSSLKRSQILLLNGRIQIRGIGDLPDHWVMYVDGSYTLKGAGTGIMLIPPEGDMLKYAIQIEFSATNNIA